VGNNLTPYPAERLGEDDDDGTMPSNVDQLREHVVGHRIVSAERDGGKFTIRLDDGTRVELADTDDCCAYTELQAFLLHSQRVDHIITGVGTTDGYTTWHIYADMGDVLELTVGWSAGNPFYYGYGFDIRVVEPDVIRVQAWLGEPLAIEGEGDTRA
jgi:hypothetical protein